MITELYGFLGSQQFTNLLFVIILMRLIDVDVNLYRLMGQSEMQYVSIFPFKIPRFYPEVKSP